MKYLKLFNESFDALNINEIILDIQEILYELIHDYWVININYCPKRWENPTANHHIKNDYLSVIIKNKKNKSGSRYVSNSEFTVNENPQINRLLKFFNDYETSIEFCLPVYNSDKTELFGKWESQDKISYNDDMPIVGFSLKIELDGENLDDFEYDKIIQFNT